MPRQNHFVAKICLRVWSFNKVFALLSVFMLRIFILSWRVSSPLNRASYSESDEHEKMETIPIIQLKSSFKLIREPDAKSYSQQVWKLFYDAMNLPGTPLFSYESLRSKSGIRHGRKTRITEALWNFLAELLNKRA